MKVALADVTSQCAHARLADTYGSVDSGRERWLIHLAVQEALQTTPLMCVLNPDATQRIVSVILDQLDPQVK